MSRSDEGSTERCRALTSDGDRCQHAATDGAFCHQHDESDPTIGGEGGSTDDDGESTHDADEMADDDADADERSAEESAESAERDDRDDGTADEGSDEADDSIGGAGSLLDVRRTAKAVTAEVIERPLDGVVEITQADDEWRVTVEVVERSAVPDTQDILGRYELTLDDPDSVSGYRRVSRYRRIDTDGSDPLE